MTRFTVPAGGEVLPAGVRVDEGRGCVHSGRARSAVVTNDVAEARVSTRCRERHVPCTTARSQSGLVRTAGRLERIGSQSPEETTVISKHRSLTVFVLTWPGLAACSGGARDEDPIGTSVQAVRAPAGHADPSGTAFYYLRSNSTDWGADEGSRLLPTQDSNIVARTINYTLTYDDSTSLTETIAAGPDEWGTQQTYFSTPNQATFVVPNTVSLVSGSTELDFRVHYPQTGHYVASFNIKLGALTIAPASQDAGTDGPSDSGSDGGAGGGSWQPVINAAPFGADTPLLLTDGRVAVHSGLSGTWMGLTPDVSGSYVHGTWSELASLPGGYAPLYFGSAVLADGRLIVEGGEYNGANAALVWTNLGAIYDPLANAWTSVSPPSGWSNIGDAPSAVLASGTFLLGNALSAQQALFNASTLTWTATGTGKADSNNEEGWTLLPNGKVLTVDGANAPQSELYDPITGAWTNAGSTIVTLVNGGEIGPAVLMPGGTVFAEGATQHTALYSSVTGAWSVGPDFPIVASGQLEADDAPAALLPNGHVLVVTSPGFNPDTHFFEFDGAAFTEVAKTPKAPGQPAFVTRLVNLPTGQILETDGSSDVEIYTPTGSPKPAWLPTITSLPSTLKRGTTYVVSGTQFNGLSQGSAYGDDAQNATNYPIVRIINNTTGHVSFARTHGHSTMAVATGSKIVSTSFDVPAGAEVGSSLFVLGANGISSVPVGVTVQ
jgi:hypothetical protein